MPRGGRRPNAGRPRKHQPPAEAPAQSLRDAKKRVRARERGIPTISAETPVQKVTRLAAMEQRFVEEYLIDLNASAAYLRAGYKGAPGKVSGLAARVIARDRVARAIGEAMAARSKRIHIDQDRVALELARIGFADIRQLFEARVGRAPVNGVELYLQSRAEGDERAFEALPQEAQDAYHAAARLVPPVTGGFFLKSPDAIDDHTAAAIAGVEVVTKSIGDGEVEHIHKFKFTEKTSSLHLLGRHLGMFHERGEGKGGAKPVEVDDQASDDELLARLDALLAKARGKRPEARA